uniref:Uncharacterized protein n=1 Tax=Tanacetum cinerariifolium TaxID=118510 RepID=A0A699HCL7_TANCI|nr:hypothetical protein [Tanacetum cinerariifolium]
MFKFGSSSSDEYDSSSSYDTSSSYVYEIVSSKGPDKKLLKCDQEFPDDDDRSNEDFTELKVKKTKTCKSKSSKSIGCKTRAFNSSKSKVVCKPKTVKSPLLDISDEDMSKSSKSQTKTLKSPYLDSSDEDVPNSSKSQAKTSKGKSSYSTAYKTRRSNSFKSKGVPQAITLKSPVP